MDWRWVETGAEWIGGIEREGESVRRDRWNWGHLGRGGNVLESEGNSSEDS